jgi:cell division protein FtsQ
MPKVKKSNQKMRSRVWQSLRSLFSGLIGVLHRVLGFNVLLQKRFIGRFSLVIIVILVGFGLTSVEPKVMNEVFAKAGLRVDDVTLEGRYRSQLEDILTVLQVEKGEPILSVDLKDRQARIEMLPWVSEARLTRRLPNVLHLQIDEYEPYALFNKNGSLILVDQDGNRITDRYLEEFKHLPEISGPGAEFQAKEIIELLVDYPILQNRLKSANWSGGRRWTLYLDHGGRVLLPALNARKALDKLMDLEREQRILAVENQSIDLRLSDRILLRSLQPSQASGKAINKAVWDSAT